MQIYGCGDGLNANLDSRQCSEQRNENLLRVWGNQDIKRAIGKRLVPVPESAS